MAATKTLKPTAVTHWIGAKRRTATSWHGGAVMNPATGEVTAEVGFASAAAVNSAVASAKAASHEWRSAPLLRRAKIMFRFRKLVLQNKQRLAKIIGLENGKTIFDALGEVARD